MVDVYMRVALKKRADLNNIASGITVVCITTGSRLIGGGGNLIISLCLTRQVHMHQWISTIVNMKK